MQPKEHSWACLIGAESFRHGRPMSTSQEAKKPYSSDNASSVIVITCCSMIRTRCHTP
jgi:hypothetical protein